jgi:TatD DNase family protein
MMTNIFDSHSHYDDTAFNEDRYKILDALPEQGVVGIINCGCDIKSSRNSIALSERYSYIHAACGIHPHECLNKTENDLSILKKLLLNKECVAVGEIGLDYHYDFSPREQQIKWFEFQLRTAVEMGLPVIVHDREAHEDTLKLLKKYRPKGVVHCFSGSVEMANELIKLEMYIGLGGAVTFKNAKKPIETAKLVPNERLLIETDCPYMAPAPFRGKRCTSDMIAYSAQVIAQARNSQPQDILDLTCNNALELFGII